MPSSSDRAQHARDRRYELKPELAKVKDLRPVSLDERYLRCCQLNVHGTGDVGRSSWRCRGRAQG